MEPKLIEYDSSPKRLEELLDDLYFILNGNIKGTLTNWHDVMFKVKVAKMGHITLTDADVDTIYKQLDPVGLCLTEIALQIRKRRHA